MPNDTPTRFASDTHAYTVVRELGKGGQGRTLLVERDDEPGSRYVLKLLRIEHVDDWKQVELFEREVTTLAALDHPGIPRLCDRIVEDGRTAGIVQSLVPGHTLAQQLAEHGPLGAARFERIVRECLEILAYLRQQVPPVLHRDINPRNVMLGPERAYLIDFGAARVGGKTDMTSVGTFGYMPPEQLIGRPEPASDMYGLGMTLVSLAERRDVGDLPQDPSSGRVDGSRLLRGMKPQLRDVLLGMIEPGLGERLSDPREALRRLDAPASLPARVEAMSREVSPYEARRGRMVVAAALGIVGVAIGGVLVLSSSEDQPPGPVVTHSLPAQVTVIAPAPTIESPPLPPAVPTPERPTPPIEPEELTDENSATLLVRSTPDHALVFIDRKGTCYTPCSQRVSFGRHDVRLERAGRAVDRTVQVLEDTELNVSLVE